MRPKAGLTPMRRNYLLQTLHNSRAATRIAEHRDHIVDDLGIRKLTPVSSDPIDKLA